MKQIEETLELKIDFSKGLVPVVTQDYESREILILSFANKEAFDKTIETGYATYWSRSRNKLWIKGESSGDYLKIREVRVNCEQNSLLYLVDMVKDNACHTDRKSCYYRRIIEDKLEFI